MTDRELIVYNILCSDEPPPDGQHWEGFVAKKIVAALAQPEPEPVAWTWEKEGKRYFITHDPSEVEAYHNLPASTPLYTASPQREWQGLTDEEIMAMRHIRDWTAGWTEIRYAREIEAKLREKNGMGGIIIG